MSNREEQETKSRMSRRGFLKTGGLAVGTVALGGLVAGCGDDVTRIVKSGDSTPSDPNLPKQWDAEADIVIVGFGGVAASAAITNKEKGLNAKLLILEAQDQDRKPAGQRTSAPSTYLCGGGTWLGAGTATQVASGFTETVDEFYAATLATVGSGADEDLIRAYCENSVETYNMLVDAGVRYENYTPGCYNAPPDGFGLIYDNEVHLKRDGKLAKAVPHAHFAPRQKDANGNFIGGRGNGLFIPLETKALASLAGGVGEIRYNTRVTRLIVNAAGRVVGVAAVKTKVGEVDANGVPVVESETELFYKANKAVLLCNGGFINNKEMVTQYTPQALHANGGTVPSYAGNKMDIGTGLKMGQTIGADTRLLHNTEDYSLIYTNGNLAQPILVRGIVVNLDGERFAPEDYGGPEMGKWIVYVYPDGVWVIIDKPIYDLVEPLGTVFDFTDPTIEGLAAKLGTKFLPQTLARYNASAATGVDEQFGKDSSLVQEIKTGPFYAYKQTVANTFLHTTGGLRINPKAQVLKLDGSVIPGFYAAGAVTSHIHAQFYAAAGSTGGAITFGRIAVQNMAKETAWDSAGKSIAKTGANT